MPHSHLLGCKIWITIHCVLISVLLNILVVIVFNLTNKAMMILFTCKDIPHLGNGISKSVSFTSYWAIISKKDHTILQFHQQNMRFFLSCHLASTKYYLYFYFWSLERLDIIFFILNCVFQISSILSFNNYLLWKIRTFQNFVKLLS